MAQPEKTHVPLDRSSWPLMRRLWRVSVKDHKKSLIPAGLLMAMVAACSEQSATQPATDLFAGIAIAALILYGGTRVISGETTAGAFFSFMTALMLAYQPLRVLGRMSGPHPGGPRRH